MRALVALSASVLALQACGEDPFSRSPRPQPAPRAQEGGVQCWDGCPELAQRKSRIVAAVRAHGGDAARAALVLAVALQETTTLSAHDRDASKDQAGPSKNWSCFNLNSDCLSQVGWKEGQGRDLNDDGALEDAVGWVMTGMSKMGEEGFLCFHRGGMSGYETRTAYGCREYVAAMRQAQAYLLANPDCMSNNKRVAANIPHV